MSKRALIIGINAYPGAPLRGCLADAAAMRGILAARGYSMAILLDGDATAANIALAWARLLAGARSGDRFVVTYSGHGTSVRDLNGDEPDGLDECLCPVDFTFSDRATWIVDDQIASWIAAAKLPRDVHLTVVLDSCHAGTALREVPQSFVAYDRRVIPRMIPMPPLMQRPPDALWRHLPWPIGGLTVRTFGERIAPMTSPAEVVLLAMTQPSQLAADAYIDGGYHGAGTYALQRTLAANAAPTLRTLRAEMVRWLYANGYGGPQGQKPTCYGSHTLRREVAFS